MTITMPKKKFELSSIKSITVKAKSAAPLNAKAGHLLFLNTADGTYTAPALSTDFTNTTNLPKTACVILLEDASLSTVAKNVRAIYAGNVFESFIREAGFDDEETCPLWILQMISSQLSNVVILDEKE